MAKHSNLDMLESSGAYADESSNRFFQNHDGAAYESNIKRSRSRRKATSNENLLKACALDDEEYFKYIDPVRMTFKNHISSERAYKKLMHKSTIFEQAIFSYSLMAVMVFQSLVSIVGKQAS